MDRMEKRRMEDRIFSRMLVWLAGAAILEIFFVAANRYYVHARAGEMNGMLAWRAVLAGLGAAGIVLFFVFLFLAARNRTRSNASVLPNVLAGGSLTLGVGCLLIRTFGQNASRLMLAAVPGLAVLALVFYLYQKEFFPCVLAGEMGILSLLVFRTVGRADGKYYVLLLATVLVAVCCAWLVYRAGRNGGVLTVGGRQIQAFSQEAGWKVCAVSAVVTAVVLLLPLILGGAMAYYGIWILGAWMFILAVYFTAKLM